MPRPQLILSFQQPFGTHPEAFQAHRGPPKTIRPGLQAWLSVSAGCHGDQPSRFPMAEQQLSLRGVGEGFSFPSPESRPFCLVWGSLGGSARQQSPQPTPLHTFGCPAPQGCGTRWCFPLVLLSGVQWSTHKGDTLWRSHRGFHSEVRLPEWVSTPCRGWGGGLPSFPVWLHSRGMQLADGQHFDLCSCSFGEF